MGKVKLREIASERKETCKSEKNGYPVVGLEHLAPNEVTLSAWEERSDNTFTKMFRKGDVLFGRRRAYLKKASVAPFDGICSGDITVIAANPQLILPELLPFIIQNDVFFDFAVEKSAGSLSPRVKWEHLKNYEFELPNIDKQKELAAVLWAMDATKKAYQNLILATDELVKSQFVEMFEKYSNAFIPLSSVCVKGPQNGFYRKGAEINGTVPVMKMKQLFGNEVMSKANDCDLLNLTPTELERFLLTPDDLLFGRRSLVVEGAGKCRRVGNITTQAVFESSMLRVTLDTNRVRPRFLQCWFDSEAGSNAIVGIRAVTTIAGIKGSDLAKVMVPIVPLEKQDSFLKFAEQSDKSKLFCRKSAYDSY